MTKPIEACTRRYVAVIAVVAAVFMAASCSEESPAEPVTGTETMTFSAGSGAVDDWAKASVRSGAASSRATSPYPNGGRFGVLGYHTASATFSTSSSTGSLPNLMYNQMVEYSSGVCDYTPVKYWSVVATDKYSFIAYSPHNSPGVTLPQASTRGGGRLDIAITDKASAMSDFMLAPVVLDVTRAANPIRFDFRHMLCRIRFAIIFDCQVDSVRIDKVVINNVKNTANIATIYKTAANLATSQWTGIVGSMSVNIPAGAGDKWIARYTDDPEGVVFDGFAAYMLPQVSNTGANIISFDLTTTVFSSQLHEPIVNTFNCKPAGTITWAYNYSYLYKFTLSSPTIIGYTAMVEDWINEVSEDEIIGGEEPFY